MTSHILSRFVAALLVLSALGGLALPAQAALVYSPCLSYLDQSVTPHAAASATPTRCLEGTQPGRAGTVPIPDDEFLDPATGVVFKATGAGYEPVGLGLESEGYVELQTATAPDHGGECFSTVPVDESPCLVQESTCGAFLCDGVRVALTGCHDVKLEVDYTPAAGFYGDVPSETHAFPKGCADSPFLPVPELQPLAAKTGATSVTYLKTTWNYGDWSDLCRYAHSQGLPLTVTTTMVVDGLPHGRTVVTLCE